MQLKIDGKPLDISIVDVHAAMEQCEKQVGMVGTTPNIDLLDAVARWAYRRFEVKLTHTAAWQLWWAICELSESLRKAHTAIADLGAWLHIDATKLDDWQMLGLSNNLARVKAQHALTQGRFDGTDYKAVYDLVLLATGSESEALAAKAVALERFVDSRCGAT